MRFGQRCRKQELQLLRCSSTATLLGHSGLVPAVEERAAAKLAASNLEVNAEYDGVHSSSCQSG